MSGEPEKRRASDMSGEPEKRRASDMSGELEERRRAEIGVQTCRNAEMTWMHEGCRDAWMHGCRVHGCTKSKSEAGEVLQACTSMAAWEHGSMGV
jgi:hypothetical protein